MAIEDGKFSASGDGKFSQLSRTGGTGGGGTCTCVYQDIYNNSASGETILSPGKPVGFSGLEGIYMPRMTEAQFQALAMPTQGLYAYALDIGHIVINTGVPALPVYETVAYLNDVTLQNAYTYGTGTLNVTSPVKPFEIVAGGNSIIRVNESGTLQLSTIPAAASAVTLLGLNAGDEVVSVANQQESLNDAYNIGSQIILNPADPVSYNTNAETEYEKTEFSNPALNDQIIAQKTHHALNDAGVPEDKIYVHWIYKQRTNFTAPLQVDSGSAEIWLAENGVSTKYFGWDAGTRANTSYKDTLILNGVESIQRTDSLAPTFRTFSDFNGAATIAYWDGRARTNTGDLKNTDIYRSTTLDGSDANYSTQQIMQGWGQAVITTWLRFNGLTSELTLHNQLNTYNTQTAVPLMIVGEFKQQAANTGFATVDYHNIKTTALSVTPGAETAFTQIYSMYNGIDTSYIEYGNGFTRVKFNLDVPNTVFFTDVNTPSLVTGPQGYIIANEAITPGLALKPSAAAGRVEKMKIGDSADTPLLGFSTSNAAGAGNSIRAKGLETYLAFVSVAVTPGQYLTYSTTTDGALEVGVLANAVAVSLDNKGAGQQALVATFHNTR